MQRIISFLIVPCILMLFGCPYSSEVPVSEPSLKVNMQLLGTYQTSEDQAIESPAYLEIKKHSDTHYAVADHKYSSADSSYSISNYTAFESKVDGVSFFNLMEEGKPPYLIYRLDRISDNSFKLIEVSDNVDEKFESPKDLSAFLAKHKDLSFLYSKEETTYRRKSE